MPDEYDTTQHIERTDTGFELRVESTRGTGTRDQDTVRAELRQEDVPTEAQVATVTDRVEQAMDERRTHQPDTEDE